MKYSLLCLSFHKFKIANIKFMFLILTLSYIFLSLSLSLFFVMICIPIQPFFPPFNHLNRPGT